MDNSGNTCGVTRGLCFWTEKMPLQGAAVFLTQKLKDLPNITPISLVSDLRSRPPEEQTEKLSSSGWN